MQLHKHHVLVCQAAPHQILLQPLKCAYYSCTTFSGVARGLTESGHRRICRLNYQKTKGNALLISLCQVLGQGQSRVLAKDSFCRQQHHSPPQ